VRSLYFRRQADSEKRHSLNPSCRCAARSGKSGSTDKSPAAFSHSGYQLMSLIPSSDASPDSFGKAALPGA
jgi:hypothetical protein